jgi:hypothetical protein
VIKPGQVIVSHKIGDNYDNLATGVYLARSGMNKTDCEEVLQEPSTQTIPIIM